MRYKGKNQLYLLENMLFSTIDMCKYVRPISFSFWELIFIDIFLAVSKPLNGLNICDLFSIRIHLTEKGC